jgi:WD40 repeat protein
MNRRHILSGACIAWLGLALAPATTAQPAPAGQPLAFPVAVRPGKALECVVARGPTAPVAALAFSPDGKLLAAGGYQEVLVWDLDAGRLCERVGVGGLNDRVHALAFHKDGRRLAVAEGTPGGSGDVRVYDVETGAMTAQFTDPRDAVFSLAFSPDGKWLAGGGVDATVRVWDVDAKTVAATLKDHSDWVHGVAFSADGKFLSSASADRTAVVWEAGTWKRVNRLEEKDPVTGVAFSPDGQFVLLALAGDDDKVLRLRRRDNGDLARATDMGVAAPTDMTWSTKANRVVVPCTDKTVRVYDGGNGNHVLTLAGHAGWVYRAVVSPDGKTVASAGSDGTVKLWNLADGKLLATLVQLAPRTDGWLIATATGFVATSSPAALQWKATGLTTAPDQLSRSLVKPELVRKVIAGQPVPAPDPS